MRLNRKRVNSLFGFSLDEKTQLDKVFSFDIDGVILSHAGGSAVESTVSRQEALKQSDIVITGVPGKSFEPIKVEELKSGVICINFATAKNYEKEVETFAACYIPRIGPVTIAMCLRNTVRLYRNFYEPGN